ncbi:hypothetical protein OF83DRAFT_1125722 [Amylostereum chailletii]|nr:hypothetical protein OF83DRAFT_1125722 [Amylostereum chailletii]
MLFRIAPRRLNLAASSVRRYTSSAKEGSVAQSKGFNKKEKAAEDQYARKHEQEQLAKLRKQIEQKKAELAELEKQHQEVKSS